MKNDDCHFDVANCYFDVANSWCPLNDVEDSYFVHGDMQEPKKAYYENVILGPSITLQKSS